MTRRAAAARPAPIVVVQVIQLDYGKGTRGADGARLRASLPSTLPVPTLDGHALHLVYMAEWYGFRVEERTEPLLMPAASPQIAHRVRVARDEDGAVVLSDGHITKALVVERGWGRLRRNELAHSHDASWYRELIINVAQVRPPALGNVFAGEPAIERDLRQPIERRRQARTRR